MTLPVAAELDARGVLDDEADDSAELIAVRQPVMVTAALGLREEPEARQDALLHRLPLEIVFVSRHGKPTKARAIISAVTKRRMTSVATS